MDERRRVVLRGYHQSLRTGILVGNILPALRPFLTDVEYSRVSDMEGNVARVDELITVLLTKENSHFERFCDALQENGYKHWAKKLLEDVEGPGADPPDTRWQTQYPIIDELTDEFGLLVADVDSKVHSLSHERLQGLKKCFEEKLKSKNTSPGVFTSSAESLINAMSKYRDSLNFEFVKLVVRYLEDEDLQKRMVVYEEKVRKGTEKLLTECRVNKITPIVPPECIPLTTHVDPRSYSLYRVLEVQDFLVRRIGVSVALFAGKMDCNFVYPPEPITMNDFLGPDLFAIVPSIDLPSSRLPFGIHRNICSALDVSDRWKDLAANPLLDLSADKVRRLANAHEGKGQSCTSALLEQLWTTKQAMVGEMMAALERMELLKGSITTHLENYLRGLISEEECARTTAAGLLTDDPKQPLPQRCCLIPKPRHFVAKREDMIATIETQFEAMEEVCQLATTAVKIPTVVIEADPGFGKSQIARQYGEQYFKKQVGAARAAIVFTLHAGNLEELCSSYLEFATLLEGDPRQLDTLRSMSSSDVDTLAQKLDTLIGIVSEKLQELSSKLEDRLQWLVIVDNLLNWPDPDKEEVDVLEFLPYYNNPKMKEECWGKGRVLITMQLKGKFKEYGEQDAPAMLSIIRLEEHQLSEDMAAELLLRVAEPETELTTVQKPKSVQREMKLLAKKLDFIPLALVTAAVFKKSMTESNAGFSWAMCLQHIQAAMHRKVHHTEYRYGCLQEVTRITLQRLAETCEVTKMAFIVVGYCKNQSIPSELIKQFMCKQVSMEDDMQIMKLEACPLLSCTSAQTGPDKTRRHTLYRMHQVTHGILQAAMLPQWEEQQPLASPHFRPLLGVALELNEESDVAQKRFLGSHLISLAAHARKEYHKHVKQRQWKEIPDVICAAVRSSDYSPLSMDTQLEYIQDCVKMAMSDEIEAVTKTDQARYRSVECGVLVESGKEQQARDVGVEALSIMVKEKAPAQLIASSLQSLSWHYGDEVHFGIKTMESHLHYVAKASGGEDTRQYAVACMQLGELWKKIDRNKARKDLETAVDILSKEGDSVDLSVALSYYSRFLLKSWSASDLRKALRMSKRCTRMMEKLVSKDTMLHIDRYITLGRAYMMNFEPSEAVKALTPYLKKVRQLHRRPGAEWRLQHILAQSHLMKGDIDKCLALLRRNAELQEQQDIHVSPTDRRMTRLAVLVLPVVNWLLVKPISAMSRLCMRKKLQMPQQPAIEEEEDMETD